jgi:hypothetical protein
MRADVADMVAQAKERLRFCAVRYAGEHLATPVSDSDLANESVAACSEYAERVRTATEIVDPYSGVQARKDAEDAAYEAAREFISGVERQRPQMTPHPDERKT